MQPRNISNCRNGGSKMSPSSILWSPMPHPRLPPTQSRLSIADGSAVTCCLTRASRENAESTHRLLDGVQPLLRTFRLLLLFPCPRCIAVCERACQCQWVSVHRVSKHVFGYVFVRVYEWKESTHEGEGENPEGEKEGRRGGGNEAQSKPAVDMTEWYWAVGLGMHAGEAQG